MKSKGQVLVIFVLLIPIIISAMIILFDLGYYHLQTRKIDQEVNNAITYYQKEKDLEKIKFNLKEYQPEITIEGNQIKITINYRIKSVIIKHQNIEKTYLGD